MISVALLSNPRSTGNQALLPRVRAFCALRADVFHYEVDDASGIGDALRSIALVRPRIIAINGGDGTVQAALTELYTGSYFDGAPPPIAVLPNGKTNLIALDLGARKDPIAALQQVIAIAHDGLDRHVIRRELISLTGGGLNREVLGMFLGGAGLVEAILYCRRKIYPLGLPNGISHMIAAIATLLVMLLGVRARFLPRIGLPVRVSIDRAGQVDGQLALMIVTTLEKMLLHARIAAPAQVGRMTFFAIERNIGAIVRGLYAALRGRLGEQAIAGVHFERGDTVTIAGTGSSVILDGELFEATPQHPLTLRSTPPVPFVRLAA